ncbi:MAG: hypothetical protein PVG70_05570 [Desulfobacterales bacterium]
MKSNPCRQCQLKNKDKNNQMCMYCEKRLAYINHLELVSNFGITNTEERPPTPRLPTLSGMAYLFTDSV